MNNQSNHRTPPVKIERDLTGWDILIGEAKDRIIALKRSIRTWQDMRDEGVPFPDPAWESEALAQKAQKKQYRAEL